MADQFTPEQIAALKDQLRQLNEQYEKLAGKKFFENMPDDIKLVNNLVGVLNDEIYDLEHKFDSISKTLQNILVDFNGVGKISSSINGSFNKLVSLTSKVQEHASGTNVLSVKELKNIKNRAAIETQNLIDRADSLNKEINSVDKESELYKKLFKQQTELNGAIKDKKSYLYTINSLIDSEITKEKNLQSKYGLTGAAIKGIAGSLQKMGVSSVFFNDLEEDVRKAAISGGSLKAAFTGVVGLAKGFGQAITDPATIMTFLVTQANKADQQTTKLAKSMMQTKFEAMQTREQFVGMANASGDAFINTDKLLEANAELGKQMGFNKVFSQDMNQTFVDLTKKIGLSEEAAGGLARISTATGRTLKATERTIAETTSRISAQNGIQLDGKDILEESGKISGQLLANFKGNPAAIAEAVAQTKVLGTTLEQTKNQASKLLDFESSIGNQLKAELLTGQQLNLERARAYALQGNQVGVATELTKQGMDFNKFSRLNVIQQNAFADALGLTSDQLTDQLLKQAAIGKSRSEIVALAGEEAAKRLESLSAHTCRPS
jgi:predicted  nucleic acid-binding Zn-ribbon protein